MPAPFGIEHDPHDRYVHSHPHTHAWMKEHPEHPHTEEHEHYFGVDHGHYHYVTYEYKGDELIARK